MTSVATGSSLSNSIEPQSSEEYPLCAPGPISWVPAPGPGPSASPSPSPGPGPGAGSVAGAGPGGRMSPMAEADETAPILLHHASGPPPHLGGGGSTSPGLHGQPGMHGQEQGQMVGMHGQIQEQGQDHEQEHGQGQGQGQGQLKMGVEHDRFLMTELADMIRRGAKSSDGWNTRKGEWTAIAKRFNARFGLNCTVKQLRNRQGRMRQKWIRFLTLKGMMGANWNAARDEPNTDDPAWQEWLDKHPSDVDFVGWEFRPLCAVVFGEQLSAAARAAREDLLLGKKRRRMPEKGGGSPGLNVPLGMAGGGGGGGGGVGGGMMGGGVMGGMGGAHGDMVAAAHHEGGLAVRGHHHHQHQHQHHRDPSGAGEERGPVALFVDPNMTPSERALQLLVDSGANDTELQNAADVFLDDERVARMFCALPESARYGWLQRKVSDLYAKRYDAVAVAATAAGGDPTMAGHHHQPCIANGRPEEGHEGRYL